MLPERKKYLQNLFYVIQHLKINKIHKIYFCDLNLEGKNCGTSFRKGLLKSRGKMANPFGIYINFDLSLKQKKKKKKIKLVAKIRKLYL